MAVSNEFQAQSAGSGCFKEAVCIDTRRIYDSCSECHGAGWIPPRQNRPLRYSLRVTRREKSSGAVFFVLSYKI